MAFLFSGHDISNGTRVSKIHDSCTSVEAPNDFVDIIGQVGPWYNKNYGSLLHKPTSKAVHQYTLRAFYSTWLNMIPIFLLDMLSIRDKKTSRLTGVPPTWPSNSRDELAI